MRGRIERAVLLERLLHSRQRTTTRPRVTSSSEVTEQAPRLLGALISQATVAPVPKQGGLQMNAGGAENFARFGST